MLSPSPHITIDHFATLESGESSGVVNMATDDALLEWVRHDAAPNTLIMRTYRWPDPTVSLGVHQKERDLPALQRLYQQDRAPLPFVRRPTGGRAICHGKDLSFSVITNSPVLTQTPLATSYGTMMAWVQDALRYVGIETQGSDEQDSRAYTTSAVCFETQTPWDLKDLSGQKICGAAQCRRDGGLLQHGAIFCDNTLLEPLTPALFDTVSKALTQASQTFKPPLEFNHRFINTQERYIQDSEALDKALTTSGSQSLPASD